MFHQPRQDRRFVTEWFLRAAFNVTLMLRMISRISITAFSMSPFSTLLSLFTASSVLTSALHISATRFLNAIVASSVPLVNVISRLLSKSMNFATLSIVQGSSTPLFFKGYDPLVSSLLARKLTIFFRCHSNLHWSSCVIFLLLAIKTVTTLSMMMFSSTTRSSLYDIVVPRNLYFSKLSGISFLTASIFSSSLILPNLFEFVSSR